MEKCVMVDIDEDVCNFCKEHLEVNRAAFECVAFSGFAVFVVLVANANHSSPATPACSIVRNYLQCCGRHFQGSSSYQLCTRCMDAA